jgi:hypothetical protein
MVAHVGYSVAGQLSGQVVLCAVYTMHVETRSASFLFEPQNQGQRFVSGLATKPLGRFLNGLGLKSDGDGFEWFALKTTRTVFVGFSTKPVVTVLSSLASKLVATIFSSLASKLVATVSPGLASKLVVGFLVEPQNRGGGGFPGLGLKTSSSDLVI